MGVLVTWDRPLSLSRPRLDPLRYCSFHGKPWAAVYLLQPDGRSYEYAHSIPITKTRYRLQYTDAETVVLDARWVSREEECAWCGVLLHHGPFHCSKCNKLMCDGMSNGTYFRCFCGFEGWAVQKPIRHMSLVPRIG